jgi:hypothetical protein
MSACGGKFDSFQSGGVFIAEGFEMTFSAGSPALEGVLHPNADALWVELDTKTDCPAEKIKILSISATSLRHVFVYQCDGRVFFPSFP